MAQVTSVELHADPVYLEKRPVRAVITHRDGTESVIDLSKASIKENEHRGTLEVEHTQSLEVAPGQWMWSKLYFRRSVGHR